MNRVVGRGWATVDLDRAATELADLLEGGSAFTDAPRSEILGARTRRGRARGEREGQAGWIVLLEPDREGRLAAFLARNGESWAATWSVPAADPQERAGAPGPLGRERLTSGTPVAGPFTLLLTTATIEP